MKVGTERIGDIVTSLRNFSRLDEAEFKQVDVHEGIDSTLMILRLLLKPSADSPTIQVTKDSDQLPAVECYPGQLNQSFMNLLSSAIEERNMYRSPDAIAEAPSESRISTSLRGKDHVSIRIADNGLGIYEEELSRLFDPFCTTKLLVKVRGFLSVTKS